jgi:hypothetical protein
MTDYRKTRNKYEEIQGKQKDSKIFQDYERLKLKTSTQR